MAARPEAPTVLVSKSIAEAYGDQLSRALSQLGGVLVTPATSSADRACTAAFLSVDGYWSGELPRMGELVESSPVLDWVHIGWAGVEHPAFATLAARGVTLTSSSGAGASAVAQHAIGCLLSLLRGLHRAWHAQRRHEWDQFVSRDVDGATVVVVGMGPIGQEVARLGQALGARVIGVRRTVPATTGAHEVWPLSRLDDALQQADAVVLALPLTRDTQHLLDSRRLGLLRPDAVLVNVGRGGLVDETALVDALGDGRLAGAALDVTEVEPLPEESLLWDLPNVLLTPHVAGQTTGTERRAAEQFVSNLERWVHGVPLQNLVDRRVLGVG